MPDTKEVEMKEATDEANRNDGEEQEPMDTSSQSGAAGIIEEKAQESQSASPSANAAAALSRLLIRLNAGKLPKIEEPAGFFRFLGAEIKKSFNGLNRHPKPIGAAIRLNEKDWKRADAYAQHLTADFCRRAELLVQRLDVTVESFLWSDRVRDMENTINEVYLPQRNALNSWSPVGVADALGATEDLLVLEKASSRRQQVSTRSKITSFTLPNAPKDRGGRMGEVRAPVRESFGRENRARGGWTNRGGHSGHGHGGRNRFDQYGKQKDNKVENQVKREYSEQHEKNENGGGNKHGGRRGGQHHGGRHGKRQRPS